jgi:hypothetical protein
VKGASSLPVHVVKPRLVRSWMSPLGVVVLSDVWVGATTPPSISDQKETLAPP